MDIEASKIAKITRISRIIINKIIKSVSYTTIQFSNLDENIIYNKKSYDGLVGYGIKAHYRASNNKQSKIHINGIELFGAFFKRAFESV